jgi:hypothetical protein
MARTLDYGVDPRSKTLRKKLVLLLCAAAAIFLVFKFVALPFTSGDIRLDTGDLRYRVFGIPMYYDRMPKPQRSQLLKLAATSSILKSVWCECVSYPLRGSNNPDNMCRYFYVKAAMWIPTDPHLAQLIVEDIATYIQNTKARQGLPSSLCMLGPGGLWANQTGVLAINPNWRQDPGVQNYLQLKGYVPPATQTASK